MNKITFEDATLVSQAKVSIGGNDYEITPATYSGGTDLNANTFNTMQSNIENAIPTIEDLADRLYPVGSIYMSVSNTNPNTLFGIGTWELWGAGRVPVGVDTNDGSFNTVEKTGGEKAHTLSIGEMPSHTHNIRGAAGGTSFPITNYGDFIAKATEYEYGFNTYTGGNQAHNNLQPYITCYMWKRTA